jgi:mannose-1-phosphate guanylyltransferase
MQKIAVILAGGIGERFWPQSTEKTPKQFLQIYNNKTLIENTLLRLKNYFGIENIYIITNKKYAGKTFQLLKKYNINKKNILSEPLGKNTAPAILYVSLLLKNKFKDDFIAYYFPADHLILNKKIFISDLKRVYNFLINRLDGICTFGIKPTEPSTEYGYIKIENFSDEKIFSVEKFVEKPDYKTAKKYYSQKKYFWNGGMFAWKNEHILNLFKKLNKKMFDLFVKNYYYGYENCEKISIDYAIMEKADKVFMLAAEFDWNDVGDWNAVNKIKKHDANGNYVTKNVFSIDVNNCMIQSDTGKIGLIGIKDCIVIKNNDDVLICSKDSIGKMKELVSKIKSCRRNK